MRISDWSSDVCSSDLGFLYEAREDAKDPQLGRLIRALAVAGFAAMNIMGLSISVWSGAAGETRDLFHWLSAAIALPTLAYSGRVFFKSAWQADRKSTRLKLQSLMRISYAVFCLTKKNKKIPTTQHNK